MESRASDTGSKRLMRSDAARNHERILDAALAAIATDGVGVRLEDVAQRAGVGLATVYRRFDGRAALLGAVFERFLVDEVDPILASTIADEEPGRGLASGLTGIVDALVRNIELLRAAEQAEVLDTEVVQRFLAPLGDTLRRAQGAGIVRSDLRSDDLAMVVGMVVAAVGWPAGPPDPVHGLDWRRYLGLLLDALRTSPTHTPLDGRGLTL